MQIVFLLLFAKMFDDEMHEFHDMLSLSAVSHFKQSCFDACCANYNGIQCTPTFFQKKRCFFTRALVVLWLTVLNRLYRVCWFQRHMKATAHPASRIHHNPVSFNLPS